MRQPAASNEATTGLGALTCCFAVKPGSLQKLCHTASVNVCASGAKQSTSMSLSGRSSPSGGVPATRGSNGASSVSTRDSASASSYDRRSFRIRTAFVPRTLMARRAVKQKRQSAAYQLWDGPRGDHHLLAEELDRRRKIRPDQPGRNRQPRFNRQREETWLNRQNLVAVRG